MRSGFTLQIESVIIMLLNGSHNSIHNHFTSQITRGKNHLIWQSNIFKVIILENCILER